MTYQPQVIVPRWGPCEHGMVGDDLDCPQPASHRHVATEVGVDVLVCTRHACGKCERLGSPMRSSDGR